jgi:hypothetical protein
MTQPWTRERLDAIEATVWELLGRDLTERDLPEVRWCLAMQQELIDHVYRCLDRQAQRLEALERELDTIRDVDDDEAPEWETPDDRRW